MSVKQNKLHWDSFKHLVGNMFKLLIALPVSLMYDTQNNAIEKILIDISPFNSKR